MAPAEKGFRHRNAIIMEKVNPVWKRQSSDSLPLSEDLDAVEIDLKRVKE
jgi:hypothetical protein